MYTELQWGNLKETDHLEDLDVDGKITLKCIIEKLYGSVDWAGVVWLKAGTSGVLM
jgi:hypothetical protein